MKKPIMSKFDFGSYSEKHVKAKELGSRAWDLWARNVIDEYKPLTDEEIRIKLREKAHPFAVLVENWLHDLNISSVIRNCNAFCGREVYYIGHKRFDRRGAAGTYSYFRVNFVEEFEQLMALKQEYTFIAVDNLDGAKPIDDYEYPTDKPIMLVFGEEGAGITNQMRDLCEDMIYIRQYGSVRSINAAAASAVIFNDFVTKYNKKKGVSK